MDLIYAYLDIKTRGIKYEINFTKRYSCKLDLNVKPHIRIKENKIDSTNKNFYGENIDFIKLILGKNGKGKSTLLQIIGGIEKHLEKFDMEKDSWLLLYSFENNLFLIESINIYKKMVLTRFFFCFKDGKNSIINEDKLKEMNIHYPSHYYINSDLSSNIVFSNDTRILLDHFDEFHKNRYELSNIANWPSIFELFINKKIESFDFYDNNNKDNKDKDKKISFNVNSLYHSDKKLYSWIYGNDTKLISLEYIDGRRDDFLDMLIVHFLEQNIIELYFYDKESRYVRRQLDETDLNKFTIFTVNKETDLETRSDKLCDLYSKLYHSVIGNCNQILDESRPAKPEIDYIDINPLIRSLRDCRKYISIDTPFSFTFKEYNEYGKKFIEKYCELIKMSEYLRSSKLKSNFSLTGCSSGQTQMIILFSNLISIIEKEENECFILFDEPDTTLHPEWNRKFIDYLIFFISHDLHWNKRYKIFVTSHSPFLVSDFLREDVLLLEDSISVESSNEKFGLACNLGDTLIDRFFMKYPIGEYARKKIKEVFDDIRKFEKSGQAMPNDLFNKYRSFADELQDNIIKDSLLDLLSKFDKNNTILDKKIADMEKELENLKSKRSRILK